MQPGKIRLVRICLDKRKIAQGTALDAMHDEPCHLLALQRLKRDECKFMIPLTSMAAAPGATASFPPAVVFFLWISDRRSLRPRMK